VSISTRAIKDFLFNMKTCNRCNKEQPLSNYRIDKKCKDGHANPCKDCKRIYTREYQRANTVRHGERRRRWTKEYYQKNKEKINKRNKEEKKKHPEWDSNSYKRNSHKYKERKVEYARKNFERTKIYNQKWRDENKLKLNEKARLYKKNKSKTNPLFKVQNSLRSRIKVALIRRGYEKTSQTHILLGAPNEIVIKHIERQFPKGMTWENYGLWQIDHIIPLASAKTKEEMEQLCHYTNLQPMWAKDNMSKGKKIIPTQIKLTI
jgi:hypothetical protein